MGKFLTETVEEEAGICTEIIVTEQRPKCALRCGGWRGLCIGKRGWRLKTSNPEWP